MCEGYPDPVDLEAEIAAVYANQLPIPQWWPAQERAAFIAIHAGEAASAVLSELDAIVDRMHDWAARTTPGLSGQEIAAMITAEQRSALAEARTSPGYDFTAAIAATSATLTADDRVHS